MDRNFFESGIAQRAREGFDLRNVLLSMAAFLLVLVSVVYLSSGPETNVLLDGDAVINRTEDNVLGTVIVRNNQFPRLYTMGPLDTCIYTAENRSPLLLETDRVENRYLEPNEVATFRIEIDIPAEDLDRDGLQRNFSLERREYCPIRSEPRIIVKE